jgi:Lipocalin-like domain
MRLRKCYFLSSREEGHVKSIWALSTLCVILVSSILSGCSSHDQALATPGQRNSNQTDSSHLEGAYEFISETLTITEPEQRTEELTSNEWAGLWLFKDGHFSEMIMKRPHSEVDRSLTQGPREYGFEGYAGTYKVEGSNVELKNDLSIYPLAVNDTRILQFRLEGNKLTLTEGLTPNRESQARGNRITVLRRIER